MTDLPLCECCEEHTIDPVTQAHGHLYCTACSTTRFCSCCDKERAAEHRLWETGDETICDECRAADEQSEWLTKTCEAVEALAEEHGWECDDWQHAQTGSRYVALSRGSEMLTIRVSDHGSAYCREDYSIAMDPSGDDHSLEIVAERLAQDI